MSTTFYFCHYNSVDNDHVINNKNTITTNKIEYDGPIPIYINICLDTDKSEVAMKTEYGTG